jgi:cation diffusion facilitator family transporter
MSLRILMLPSCWSRCTPTPPRHRGLLINGASVLLLGGAHDHHHGHEHDHAEDHGHHHNDHHHSGPDYNLRSAYLHVLADALPSVLAIVALLAGRYLGVTWLDPTMGIVGAALVARWAWELLRDTGSVLLDQQARQSVQEAVRAAIERGTDDRIADLHVWAIGPDLYAAALSVVTHAPYDPEHYKARLPAGLGIAHATVEVHMCREHASARAA